MVFVTEHVCSVLAEGGYTNYLYMPTCHERCTWEHTTEKNVTTGVIWSTFYLGNQRVAMKVGSTSAAGSTEIISVRPA